MFPSLLVGQPKRQPLDKIIVASPGHRNPGRSCVFVRSSPYWASFRVGSEEKLKKKKFKTLQTVSLGPGYCASTSCADSGVELSGKKPNEVELSVCRFGTGEQ
jgi:hypothetical protein